MTYGNEAVYDDRATVAGAEVSERVAFLRRTYGHLAGAIFFFVGIELLLFQTGVALKLFNFVYGTGFGWIGLLVGFMVVGWIADRWARNGASESKQYLGLGLYTVAEAVMLAPLLYFAANYTSPDVIPAAAVTTLCAFGGLTGVVFFTKKDFSFLGPALGLLSLLGLGIVICSLFLGLGGLGLWVAVGFTALMGGYVLYYTSQIMHHYPTDAHVAASLALFATMATMFWYILQICISLAGDD